MDMHQVFEFINYMFHAVLGYIYVYILTSEWRFPKKTVKQIIFAACLFFILIAGLLLYNMGLNEMSKGYLSLLSFAIGIPFCLYLPKYRGGRALFICFTAILFDLASIEIGEVIGSTDTGLRMFIKIIIYGLVFFFVCKYFRKPLNRLMKEMKNGWHRMSLVPLSFSILCFVLLLSGQIYENRIFKFVALAFVVVIACTYITFYHIFSVLQEQYRMKSNYALLNAQMEALQRQLETVEQLRIFQHDIRHYVQLQRACLAGGDVDAAKEILRSIKNTLDKNQKKIPGYTKVPYINAVIANYWEKAKACDISFTVKMETPAVERVEPVELAVVIANVLENAWHACAKIPEKENRSISLIGVQRPEEYFLEIINTYQGEIAFNEEKTAPVTEEKGHGYGVQSIIAFAEKYKAYVEFKKENGVFKVRMIL